MAIQFCHEESEARNKWCPFARTSYSTVEEIELGGVNRAQGPNEVSCIASDCMMWRWVETHINNPAGGDMMKSENTHGYCGLAGSR